MGFREREIKKKFGGHPPQIFSLLSASPLKFSHYCRHPPSLSRPIIPLCRIPPPLPPASARSLFFCLSLLRPPPPCQQPKVHYTCSRGGGRVPDRWAAALFPLVSASVPPCLSFRFPPLARRRLCASSPPCLPPSYSNLKYLILLTGWERRSPPRLPPSHSNTKYLILLTG